MEQESISIVKTETKHVIGMNKLSRIKRMSYEKTHPIFWKWGGEEGESCQIEWFKELVGNNAEYICLTAESSHQVKGFIIGAIINAPKVYKPGCQTIMVDDFCVDGDNWKIIGNALIEAMKKEMDKRSIKQLVIVCGSHDDAKRDFIESTGLLAASYWYVGSV